MSHFTTGVTIREAKEEVRALELQEQDVRTPRSWDTRVLQRDAFLRSKDQNACNLNAVIFATAPPQLPS